MEKKTIIIFTANKARELLKDGFKVVDIKPDKTDSDGKRSVFVFEYADGILDRIKKTTK
ncbi:MAG: hypothetical protein [Bacteriophage sp.]|jgi:hypothetical protein|nr:MAG: hypothetical protein [Bacteriophage sp.]